MDVYISEQICIKMSKTTARCPRAVAKKLVITKHNCWGAGNIVETPFQVIAGRLCAK